MHSEHDPIARLTSKLTTLRADMVHLEEESAPALCGVAPAYADSARNLLHYVALRRHDVRPLQERLAELGLSSLGRAEGCVLATVSFSKKGCRWPTWNALLPPCALHVPRRGLHW